MRSENVDRLKAAEAQLYSLIAELEAVQADEPNDTLHDVINDLRWQFVRLCTVELGDKYNETLKEIEYEKSNNMVHSDSHRNGLPGGSR